MNIIVTGLDWPVELVVWAITGGGVGLLIVTKAYRPSESPPWRARRFGAVAGAALGLLYFTCGIAVDLANASATVCALAVALAAATGGAVNIVRRGGSVADPVDVFVNGMLAGAVTTAGLALVYAYPAETLTVIGLAATALPPNRAAQLALDRVFGLTGISERFAGVLLAGVLVAPALAFVQAGATAPWIGAIPLCSFFLTRITRLPLPIVATLAVIFAALVLVVAALLVALWEVVATLVTRLPYQGRPAAPLAPLPEAKHEILGKENRGEVVVLLHGFLRGAGQWRDLGEGLAARGRVVVMPELVWGLWGDRISRRGPVLPQANEQLARLLTRLKQDYGRDIALVGFSFGAVCAREFTADARRHGVARVVLIAPPGLDTGGWVAWLSSRLALMARFVPLLGRLGAPVVKVYFGQLPFGGILETLGTAQGAAVAINVGPRVLKEAQADRPAAPDVPVTVILSDEDRVVSVRGASHPYFGHPLVRVEVGSFGGHEGMLTDPELQARVLQALNKGAEEPAAA